MNITAARTSSAMPRTLRFAPRQILVTDRSDGTKILKSPIDFTPSQRSIVDFLPEWAEKAPDRICLAQRHAGPGWREIRYGQMWEQVQAMGQALIDLGAEKGDRLAILSGNSIEHAIVMFAAMAVGVVVAPISPMYSLLPGGIARIKDIAKILRPDFVFAERRDPFFAARQIPELSEATWTANDAIDQTLELSKLLSTRPGPALYDAMAAIDLNAPAKILFTSGSTGLPKGVINTHRMMVSALEMGSLLVAPDDDQWPVQVEWLPWNHTMGGNVILQGILKNGGSLYIDDGRPLPHLFDRTIANLKEVSPTAMFNVPGGYTLLCEALAADQDLRRSFFRRLDRMSYGGAAMPHSTLERLKELAIATTGRPIPIMSGYGTTETAPTISSAHWAASEPGEIGLPAPGLELKLIPHGNAYEVRVKGPNVMPGYLDRPDLTRIAFDEEGFYRVGDLVSFVDPADPNLGLRFTGRVSENFKLTNGTWVIVGDLRAAVLAATEGVLQDVVIAGEGKERCAVLAWLNPARAKPHATNQPVVDSQLGDDPGVVAFIRQRLQGHNQSAGSSAKILSFILLSEPASLAAGEVTDKAYINQRAVLDRRRELVDGLYEPSRGSGVVQV